MELSDLVKISDHEAGVLPPNTRYLPVLAVINPNKLGKVRLVLDAAAKSHGKSLNDLLVKGPDLFDSIPDILIQPGNGFGTDGLVLRLMSLRCSVRFWSKTRTDIPYGFCGDVAVAVEDLISMNHPLVQDHLPQSQNTAFNGLQKNTLLLRKTC